MTERTNRENRPEKYVTDIRREIGGKQVNIRLYGRDLDIGHIGLSIIEKDVLKGRKSGYAECSKNEERYHVSWYIPFEDIKEGDTVEFSTSGKYNPGFHATEKYIGIVEKLTGEDVTVKCKDRKAIVKLKHIERVIK